MNTVSYKGHYIHMRWVGIKGIAYRVQLTGNNFIYCEVLSLKSAQRIISNFVNTGEI